MATKIAIAAGDTVTNPDALEFVNLATGQQQLIYLIDRLQQAQSAFNTTDPAPIAPINRVALVPNASVVASQVTCPIASDAPMDLLWNACQPIGAGETPLAVEATDTVTDATLLQLLGIPTLTGQIFYMASYLESQEMAYNEANPETPVNAVSTNANYDQRQAAMSTVFPLAAGGLATLVGALAY